MAGVYDAIRIFALEHHGCGERRYGTEPLTPDGYAIWVSQPGFGSVMMGARAATLRRRLHPPPQIDSCQYHHGADDDPKDLDPAEARRSPQAQGISEQCDENEECTYDDHDPGEHWTAHGGLLRFYSMT